MSAASSAHGQEAYDNDTLKLERAIPLPGMSAEQIWRKMFKWDGYPLRDGNDAISYSHHTWEYLDFNPGPFKKGSLSYHLYVISDEDECDVVMTNIWSTAFRGKKLAPLPSASRDEKLQTAIDYSRDLFEVIYSSLESYLTSPAIDRKREVRSLDPVL